MAVSAYRLKRFVLSPRTAYLRRRHRNADPVARAMLEAMGYRRSMFDFMAATAEDPEILTTFDIDETSSVVDAGAFDGVWSGLIADRYGCSIHAFEPAPPAIAAMEPALAGKSVTLHCVALGASDTHAALVLGGPGSWIGTGEVVAGSVGVEVRDVAAVFEELGLDEIDLLKLNVEGSEFDILDRLQETAWLPRIRILLIQFHEWHPAANRRRRTARRALRQSHTETWTYPWIWETWVRSD